MHAIVARSTFPTQNVQSTPGSEKVQMERKNRKTHWHEAVSSALNFPFLKEVSQNSFVFDVGNLKNRKCRRLALFLMLSSAKTEEVSLNCCVFDVVKFKN